MQAIKIEVDQEVIKKLAIQEVREAVNQIEHDLLWWDVHELCRRTSMSMSHLQRYVLHLPDLPRYRIGKKWFFPAKETEAFLLDWLSKQVD